MSCFKRKKKGQHFKGFGQSYPVNMFEVVRFSPYKTDKIGYSISECSECGKRAFGCIGLHLMGQRVCEAIDSFISHRMNLDDFTAMLEKEMAWHKFNAPSGLEQEARE